MQVFSFIFILQLEGDIGQQVGLGPVWGRLLVAAAQNVGVDGGTSATSQPPAMVRPRKPDLVELEVDVDVGNDDRRQQRQRRRRRWVILPTVSLCVEVVESSWSEWRKIYVRVNLNASKTKCAMRAKSVDQTQSDQMRSFRCQKSGD